MDDQKHIAADKLDALKLDLLPVLEKAAVESHIAACVRCKSAWDTLETSAREFEQDVFARTLPNIRQALDEKPSFWARWTNIRILVPVGGLAGAFVLAVLFLVPPHGTDSPATRIKGTPIVQAVVKRGENIFRVESGTRLKAGDRVRFRVDPAGFEYVMVVSRDGNGHVGRWFPAAGDVSVHVNQGKQELSGAIELDDSPGPERVWVVFSHQALPVEAVLRSLASQKGDGPANAGLREGSQLVQMFLEKEAL